VELLAAAADGAAPPALDDGPLLDTQKALARQLAERVRKTAEQLQLPASLLAPRSDLEALVRRGSAAPVPLLAGWRREIIGEELLRLVA
jgi:ribonuclease D